MCERCGSEWCQLATMLDRGEKRPVDGGDRHRTLRQIFPRSGGQVFRCFRTRSRDALSHPADHPAIGSVIVARSESLQPNVTQHMTLQTLAVHASRAGHRLSGHEALLRYASSVSVAFFGEEMRIVVSQHLRDRRLIAPLEFSSISARLLNGYFPRRESSLPARSKCICWRSFPGCS